MNKGNVLALMLIVAVAWQAYGQNKNQVESLPDPTRPADLQKSGEINEQGLYPDGFPQVKVSAVFMQGENKHAVINGQSLFEGQVFQGLKLVKIHSNGVILATSQTQKEFLINNNNFIKDTTDDF